ncbi:MAG TPA: BREX system ATP-binding domain-containing protein [Iamia sp.]|nr:BREX system ATP-binding domain-containing protein [Iamia sp.]
MSRSEAEKAIESLRTGIPPVGHLRRFTVGRASEIQRLEETLRRPNEHRGEALLVQANYGAGKTHLLRLIRELALDEGFAVALVTVDSRSNVRFNRMDQVAAAVMRELEVDHSSGKGAWTLFDAFAACDPTLLNARQRDVHERISAGGRWDMSDELKSPGLWVALRAWIHASTDATRDLVKDWLSSPWSYESTPGEMYRQLVAGLRPAVRDPRPDRTMFSEGVFHFRKHGHAQAWSVLSDLDVLSRLCGRRGLVLLFDEFEDVIQNMNNIGLEQDAFVNLFRLFSGERFGGMSYFAVTPDFAEKCRDRIYSKMLYEFPVERFNDLARFEVSPIRKRDLVGLAESIRTTHGCAYEWEAQGRYTDRELEALVERLYRRRSADQIRQAIQGIVVALDERIDE